MGYGLERYMGKRKKESAVKAKGILASISEAMSSCPTPSGYGSGWDIEITEEVENKIYNVNPNLGVSTYMEFDSLDDVLSWVEDLPNLSA